MAAPTCLIIAIDGPSGVGKGTVARAISRALGLPHVDTGAMYRAVGWLAQHEQVPLDDEDAVVRMTARSVFEFSPSRLTVNGHDVTTAIRTPEIDRAATSVARLPRVREVLVDRQRALGRSGGVVMDGRDIGTVVFPDADVKIYLDASPEERARRRANGPAHAGSAAGVASVAGALAERDRLDRTRAASPLAIAPDAVVIDTTDMTIEQVVERALEIVKSRLQGTGNREQGEGRG